MPLQVHEVLEVRGGGEDITRDERKGEDHSHSPTGEMHRERQQHVDCAVLVTVSRDAPK